MLQSYTVSMPPLHLKLQPSTTHTDTYLFLTPSSASSSRWGPAMLLDAVVMALHGVEFWGVHGCGKSHSHCGRHESYPLVVFESWVYCKCSVRSLLDPGLLIASSYASRRYCTRVESSTKITLLYFRLECWKLCSVLWRSPRDSQINQGQ